MKCERSTCPTPHDAREHLDPRHERYDGPGVEVTALPAGPRAAARALIAAGGPVPEVIDLVREIHALRDQVAHVRVDADRKVREASARALDCADHGRTIADLEAQVSSLDKSYREADATRGRYAVFLLGLRDSLSKIDPDRVTVRKLRDAISGEVRKILR